MSKLMLVFKYASRQMMRERQRTLFVLFSIAIGVAVIVSLRSLGWMIQNTFTHNLQAFNKGDLAVTSPGWYQAFASVDPVDTALISDGENPFGTTMFSAEGLTRLETWAENGQYEVSFASRNQPPMFVYPVERSGQLESVPIYFIDETQYPYYATTEFLSGDYETLEGALGEDNAIVVSESLVEALQVSVGDMIQVTGSTRPFRITAVVADDNEGGLGGAMLRSGYVYLPNRVGISEFNMTSDTLFIRLPDGVAIDQVEAELNQSFPGLPIFTTASLHENVQSTTDVITRLVSALGLLSLLIGGVGVYNTVTVVLRQRTLDIGILKTVGLSNGEITGLFLVEFALYGLAGSGFGAGLGVFLAGALQRMAEQLFQQRLVFAVYPEAILVGIILGVTITILTSVLPVLRVSSVRPMIVLNPTVSQPSLFQERIPSQFFLAGSVIIGLILGQILGQPAPGLIITGTVIVGLSLAAKSLSLLVDLIGRVPVRQNAYFLLAQRALVANRLRTTSTLLALVIGIFCLGFVLLLAQNAAAALNGIAAKQFGGDVIVLADSGEAAETVATELSTLPGVVGQEQTVSYVGRIVAINHNRDMDALFAAAYENGINQFSRPQEAVIGEDGRIISPYKRFDPVAWQLRNAMERFTLEQSDEAEPSYPLVAGSYAQMSDPSSLILQAGSATEWLGLSAGDTLTFAWEDGSESDLSIGGVIGKPRSSFASHSEFIQVNGLVPAVSILSAVEPDRITFALTTEDAQRQEVIRALSGLPAVTVMELAQAGSFTSQLIQQLTFVPLVVAVFSLFASGVIIANTVTLTTLERHREVGIMKVVGLHTTQFLRLLFLENGIIGLVGGGIGFGLSLIGLIILNLIGGRSNGQPGESLLIGLGLIGVAFLVSLGATFLAGLSMARKQIPVLMKR